MAVGWPALGRLRTDRRGEPMCSCLLVASPKGITLRDAASRLRSGLVATLDNPADRLRALLHAYFAALPNSKTIRSAWAKALDIEGADVPVVLPQVAALVSAIHAAVARQGRSAYQEMCEHHIEEWLKPFAIGLDNSPVDIDSSAMVALHTISDFLSERASEGVVPDEDAPVAEGGASGRHRGGEGVGRHTG